MKTVVPDNTCLIALERIGKLNILSSLFDSVLIPPAVDSEFGQVLDWLKVEPLITFTISDLLKMTVGKGEAEAIALAIQLNCLLITDDKQARSIAEQLGLSVKGTLGTLIDARRSGIIDQLKPIVEDMESNGFHISKALRDEILLIVGE